MKTVRYSLMVLAAIITLVFFSSVAFADTAYAQGRALVCVQQSQARSMMLAPTTEQVLDGFEWENLMDVSPNALTTAGVAPDLGAGSSARAFGLPSGATIAVVTSETLSTEELVAALSVREGVLIAEPDRVITAEEAWGEEFASPKADQVGANDVFDTKQSYADFQWFLKNQGLWASGKSGFDVGYPIAPPAFQKKSVVAVLDSGVDSQQQNLRGRMINMNDYPEFKAETKSGDVGYCAVKGDDTADTQDYNGHGTHVAGIVSSASTPAGVSGVSGMAPVSMVAVRVGDKEGQVVGSWILSGFNWLVRANEAGMGIRAVNVSIGGSSVSKIERVAVQELEYAGIVTVFASGNDKRDTDIEIATGSLAAVSSTLVVDALAPTGEKAAYSNFGQRSTDLFAPGSSILSSYPQMVATFNAFTGAKNARAGDKTGLWSLVYESFEESNSLTDPAIGNGLIFRYVEDESKNAAAIADKTVLEGDSASNNEPNLVSESDELDSVGDPNELDPVSELNAGSNTPTAEFASGNERLIGDKVDSTDSQWFLGKRSLAVLDKDGDGSVVLLSDAVNLEDLGADSTTQLYAGVSAFASAGRHEVMLQYRLKDGSFSEKLTESGTGLNMPVIRADNSQWRASLNTKAQALPENVDLKNFQLKVSIGFSKNTPDVEVYLDSVGVGVGRERFSVIGGTSMAAPMVTGALALLASAYPDESPHKLSARILGGTKAEENLTTLCSTGGRLSLDLALNNPNPALQMIEVDGDQAMLKGWFFHEGDSLKVAGVLAQPTQWKTGEDGLVTVRFTIPQGASDGVNEVRIETQDGRAGRGFFDLGTPHRLAGYTDLPLPDANELSSPHIVAAKNSVYLFAGTTDYSPWPRFFSYDTTKSTWSPAQEIPYPEAMKPHDPSMIQWGKPVSHQGRVYVIATFSESIDVSSSWLMSYDPSSGEWFCSPDQGNGLGLMSLLSWRGELCGLGGARDSGMTPLDEVVRIDPLTGAREVIGHLPIALSLPKVVASGSELILVDDSSWDIESTSLYVTDLTTSKHYDFLLDSDATLGSSWTLAPVKEGAMMVGLGKRDGLTQSDTTLFDKATGVWSWTDKLCSGVPSYEMLSAQYADKLYVWGYSSTSPDFYFFRVTDVNDPNPGPQPGTDPEEPGPDPILPTQETSPQSTSLPTGMAKTGDSVGSGIVVACSMLALATVVLCCSKRRYGKM